MTRGEIWMADLGYNAKIRPVLILSVPIGKDDRSLVAYVNRTTSVRNTPYEVPHKARGMKPGVFDAQGLGTTDKHYLIRRLGTVDATTLAQVEDRVKAWLGL